MTGEARYARALERLAARERFGIVPGLERVAAVLGALGNPERALPALHVAGTNGKGSTAAMAEAMLRAQGARVGLYTSPHLSRFTERIRIAGDEIDRAACAGALERALDAPGGEALTFFEAATVAALLAFAEAAVDLAVIEVGLGGRLDATNLCAPFACAVVSIGFDHTAILGPTLAAIAREKAGIAKPGVPLVVGPVGDEALAAITGCAAAAGAPLLRWGRDLEASREASGTLSYRGPGGALAGATLALDGPHQASNAAVALAGASFAPRFAPSERARRDGLAAVRWPARLERFGALLLDGAHNEEGARALVRALAPRRFTLLVGALADKDVPALLGALAPLAARGVCTRAPSPRALDGAALTAELSRVAPGVVVETVDDPAAALDRARSLAAGEGGEVLACGSIFLVALLRRLLTGEAADPLAVSDPGARAP